AAVRVMITTSQSALWAKILREILIFFFQAEDGIRDSSVTGVQTCALPIYLAVGAGRGAAPAGVGAGTGAAAGDDGAGLHVARRRSEERRVGKECRSRWSR